MRIEAIDQEDADIDWFAVDRDGHIVYFASGGGVLPESVAASQENLLALHAYFLSRPETEAAAQVQPEPNAVTSGRSAEGFVRYARRGLFAFDKTRLPERHDPHYHLVARPARPLTLAELPPELATLLRRTQVLESVLTAAQVAVNAIR